MRVLSPKELKSKGITFCRAHIHVLVSQGKFPRPIKLGTKCNAWVESEIDEWLQARVAERDRGAA
ncbi:helix-turn-helix transcriptional regulator [Sinorhizobium meliloti]|uniref:helix-turn-helix transcriptional regulator n=1 Tax=Rhizobium meliloti TaxID=382 RepID=UPI003F154C96